MGGRVEEIANTVGILSYGDLEESIEFFKCFVFHYEGNITASHQKLGNRERGKDTDIYFTLMYFFWIFGRRQENNNFHLFNIGRHNMAQI